MRDTTTEAESSYQVVLPDFCSWQVILAAMVLAEIVLLATELIYQLSPDWRRVGVSSLLVVVLAISTLGLLCISRNWLNQFEGVRGWWLSWLLSVSAGFVVAWLAWPFLSDLAAGFGLQFAMAEQLNFSLRVALVEAMIAAAILRYYYFQQLWQHEMLSQAEARVQALQSRIRPHFLFNSLNSIAALIPEDPQKAELATEDLADLFRSALGDARKVSSLRDELDVVNKYLRIEQHRLGSRLEVQWRLGEVPLDAQVPPLILQPLVENAITHGVEPSSGVGIVEISSAFDGENVVLVVSSPISKARVSKSGNQIAITNIRERLHYHYAGCASLSLQPQGDQFQAILRFPYVEHTSG